MLWPTVPIEQLGYVVEDENILQAMDDAKDSVDDLAGRIAGQLDL